MSFDAHANFAYATVDTPPTPAASGTSLTVATGLGSLFPAAPFNAVIYPNGTVPLSTNAEIVRVTLVVGDVFTITRQEEGTSARTILAGDQIAAAITVRTLTDVETAIPSIAGLLSAINVSAGATSNNLSALTFDNSNGVSFGLTGSVITATVATNYQSQGNYLTTAALSQDSSNYAGTNGAITGGSITVNTSGVSVNLPNYLTTAMASNRGSDFVQATAVFHGTNASGTIASGAISVSVAAAGAANINFSAGTTSNNLTQLSFKDTNGVSFGLNAGTLTATVKTDYQTAGNYLTTAMASNRGTDFVQATAAFAGTNASGTINSTGISVSVAAPSAASVNFSAGTTSNNLTQVSFKDTNGVSFGLNAGTITATVATNYQSQGAYLTTAALSADSSKYAGTNGAITGGSITVNTSGVSVNLPAYLTTAALSGDTSKYVQAWAISGNTAGTTSSAQGTKIYFQGGNSLTVSGSSNTIVFSVGNYLTTAALSADSSKYAGTGFTSAGANIGLSGTHNTAGLSLSATVAAQSNQSAIKAFGVSNTGATAGNTGVSTGIDWVLAGSSPLSLSQSTAVGGPNTVWIQPAAWLTTAMASNRASDFVAATAAFAGTNASGTINSTGISVSVAAPSAASFNVSAGTTSNNLTQLSFKDSQGVSFGLNAGTLTATVKTDYLTTAALSGDTTKYVQAWELTGNTAGTTSSAQGTKIYFSGGNSITVSGNSNTIVLSVGAYLTTAALSADSSKYAGTNGAITGGSITVNTSGVSVNLPAYLTTADLSANSSKYAQAWELTGNTAGTTSSVQGTKWYFSGGNSLTVSGNSNTLVFSVGNYLTTAALSADSSKYAGTGFTSAGANISFSGTLNTAGLSLSASVAAPGAAAENNWIALTGNTAGNTTASGSTIAWSGGNGVTLSGTNGSVVQISVSTYSTTSYNVVSIQTTEYPVASANSVGTVTRWAAEDHRHAGIGGIGISTSGNTDGTTGSVIGTYWLQGVGGVTISQITSNNGSHTAVFSGAGAASPQSYYLNIDNYQGMATGASAISQVSGSSIWVQPFIVRNDVSASYLRLLGSFNDTAVGTAGTTSANSTYSVQRYSTFAVVVYSQGVGASSRSIQYMTSGSAGITGETKVGAGVQGSRYTVSLAKTYPSTGVTDNQYTTSYPVSSASFVISSNSNTLFTGPHYLDVPLAISLSAGNYWLGLGASTNSASQSANISFAGTAGMAFSMVGLSQTALTFAPFGAASAASDQQLQVGLGAWSTNALVMSTSSIALSNISQVASNPQLPFQLIRQA